MDKIHINSLNIYAFHGVNDFEKRKGQPFVLDITLDLDLSKPCLSDNVEDTVSYSDINKLVQKVMQEDKYDLIERVAYRVCEQIILDFSAIEAVEVLLKKPRAPIGADFENVAVRIYRERKDIIK